MFHSDCKNDERCLSKWETPDESSALAFVGAELSVVHSLPAIETSVLRSIFFLITFTSHYQQ